MKTPRDHYFHKIVGETHGNSILDFVETPIKRTITIMDLYKCTYIQIVHKIFQIMSYLRREWLSNLHYLEKMLLTLTIKNENHDQNYSSLTSFDMIPILGIMK